jgi:predicted MFS family arabinose efflux permease
MSSILFEKKQADVNSIRVRLAAILISVCTMMYFINMPLMLGLAVKDLSLEQSQVWLLGGLFLGGVALAAVLSILFIRIAHWQRLIFISGFMSLLAFLLPVFVSGFTTLLICQALAGFFAGIGYAVAIACLGDTRNPTRNYALALTAQTATVAIVSYLLPQLVVRGTTFNEALMAVAGLSFVALLLGTMMPKNGKRASLKSAMTAQNPTAVFITLFVLLLVFVGGSSVRNSIEPIASRLDFAATEGGGVMIILLLASGLGSLIAAFMGAHSSYTKPMVIALGIAVTVLVLGVFQLWPEQVSLIFAFCLVGGAWNFAAAYGMGLTAKLDGSGKYTPLIAAMQIIGNVAGIAIVGSLVVGGSYVLPYMLACIVWIVALVIVIQVVKRNQKLITASND